MFIRSFGSLIVLLTLAAGPVVAQQDAQPAKRNMQKHAVLVGINAYAGVLGKLEYCHNDMTDLRDRLIEVGFPKDNIVFLHELESRENTSLWPSKANIDAQLKLRMSIASPGDLVLVAFSGHGLYIDGKSYFCPLDAKLDNAAGTMIAVEDVYRDMQASQAAQKLLVIDACRNEPVKGVRSAPNEGLTVTTPPKGVRVLSSCDAGQTSMEDAKLKHGVFMYYVTQGLAGAADTDVEGNQNGKISLDELYFYAHEKTKVHVANKYSRIQVPTLNGEFAGSFDIASVPELSADERLLRQKPLLPQPEPSPSTPAPKTETPVESVASATTSLPSPSAELATHPLLTQGNIYCQRGDYDHAIIGYTALMQDDNVAASIREQARLGRSRAYLGLGGRENVHRALIDQQSAGRKALAMPVVKVSENLKVTSNVVGTVKQNEVVEISEINGDWLWVCCVNGNEARQGYIPWDCVLQPAAPKPAVAAVQPAAQANGMVAGARSVAQPATYNQPVYNNQQSSGGYSDGTAPKALYRELETQENKLERMYDRNASNGAIRAQEKKVEQHERRVDRAESRGGRGGGGGGGGRNR